MWGGGVRGGAGQPDRREAAAAGGGGGEGVGKGGEGMVIFIFF